MLVRIKDDEGGITLDSEDHSISFSWNRQITPEDQKIESTNRMISDVMATPRSAGGSTETLPRSSKKQHSLDDLEWDFALKIRFMNLIFQKKYLEILEKYF